MFLSDKWCRGVTPEDSLRSAAEHALLARLADVQYCLPLAAKRAEESSEYVHKLRVSTRRASAALTLYGHLLAPDKVEPVAAWLKRARKVAGRARDLDVLLEHQGHAHKEAFSPGYLEELQEKRKKAQRSIKKLYKKFRKDRLPEQIAECLDSLSAPPVTDDIPFPDWACHAVRPLARRFFAIPAAEGDDFDALHRLRIRTKELRYAMELLAPAFPPRFREEVFPVVEKLQDVLGGINDHRNAIERIMARGAPEQKKLLSEEKACLERALGSYRSFWTPEQRRALQRQMPKAAAARSNGHHSESSVAANSSSSSG